jgi:hypothetical protein
MLKGVRQFRQGKVSGHLRIGSRLFRSCIVTQTPHQPIISALPIPLLAHRKTQNRMLRILAISLFSVIKVSVNPVNRRPPPLFKSDRRPPNAERRPLNAEHRALNAERRTLNAERLLVVALCIATCALTGCNNRTRDAVRWDQIAEAQRTVQNVQPWSEARRPWANVQYHTGTAW